MCKSIFMSVISNKKQEKFEAQRRITKGDTTKEKKRDREYFFFDLLCIFTKQFEHEDESVDPTLHSGVRSTS